MKRLTAIVLLLAAASLAACNLQREEPGYAPFLALTKTAKVTTPSSETAQPVLQDTTEAPAAESSTEAYPYPWWNQRVFYEIFVRSFYDSNGDGIGDLNGIIEKLDYLNDGDPATTDDLGITGLWLMPINPSPDYHGYSVTDYYAINPDYGTMDDFKNLIGEAHQRGIAVIIDLVLNHTSSQHPWFQQALDPASPYHDWYIWSDSDPGYLGPWAEQVWHPAGNGEYYYGIFNENMPDLNYNNPAVTAEMEKVVQFWLTDAGVDGFRLDASKHLIEDGSVQENTPETHAWYKGFRTFYKSIAPQALTVGEIWDTTETTAKYLQGDELDLSFEFYLASAYLESAIGGSAGAALNRLEIASRLIPHFQFAPFLTNHDQNRVLTQLWGNLDEAKVAASMLLTSPGVPFLYYGEEIGMMGQKPDQDIRRPMQWNGDARTGFSTAAPWEGPGVDWQTYNVENETADPASLLSHYRSLIQLRNAHPALQTGDLAAVNTGNTGLYAVLRTSPQESVLVLINLTDAPISKYALSLNQSELAAGTLHAEALMGQGSFTDLTISKRGGFSKYVPIESIPAYATIILQIQPGTP